MEQLQFIIPQLSALLKRDVDVIKFHQECSHLYPRISYAMQILHALQAGDAVPPNDADIYIENLAKELTKIRYIPEIISRDEFLRKLPEDIETCYNLYTWLLKNGEKVRLRAYLTNFVDPLDIPTQFIDDPDVNKALTNNKELIEMFWVVYKTFSATEKHVAACQELQSDLKAMHQEAANLKKRTDVQKDKLQNIVGNESSISFGKMLYEVNRHKSKLLKKISANADIIKQMERTLSDHKALEKYGHLSVDTLVPSMRDALNTSKTLLNTSVNQEREKVTQSRLVLEDTVKRAVENNQLEKQVELLKTEIQDLTNQKIALHSSADDKLGPFRKQVAGVANRKEMLSEKVNNIRNKHMQLTNQLKLKETELYNVVGGEIYHGDKLKHFIAELRNKSIVYKKHRAKLQYWTAELTLLNRTADVLRSIDSSIKDNLCQSSTVDQNQLTSLTTNSIEEAKQVSKKLLPEIETARVLTSQTQAALLGVRKEVSTVSEKLESAKEKYTTATKIVNTHVESLKEQVQIKKDQIEILEQQWKGTTRELEKLDQVYGRLVDDALESTEDSLKQTYHDQLKEKKDVLEKSLVNLERLLADGENKKEEIFQKIKIYKGVELMLLTKLEQH